MRGFGDFPGNLSRFLANRDIIQNDRLRFTGKEASLRLSQSGVVRDRLRVPIVAFIVLGLEVGKCS